MSFSQRCSKQICLGPTKLNAEKCSAFYLLLYNFKAAMTPNIEHKLYGRLIDHSSAVLLPNNGSSIISAIVHKICANKKNINAIKKNNPMLFIS